MLELEPVLPSSVAFGTDDVIQVVSSLLSGGACGARRRNAP
jgi:hypothetical protein